MKVDHHCRWVRRRLPLLAGGELGAEERRRVERHLIVCPGCRGRRNASVDALTALRGFAQESPARADAPTLWPALALQIRQSRHAAPRPSWWEIPLSRPSFAFSVAMGLGVVLASAIRQPPVVHEEPAPLPTVAIKPVVAEPVVVEADVLAPPLRGALPDAPARLASALPQGGPGPAEPPSGLLFNYDLDHMTPMNSSNRDPQHSY